MIPEAKNEFQTFNFQILCGLCRQQFPVVIQDIRLDDAKANALQAAVFLHTCPTGKPTPADFSVTLAQT